MAHRPDTGGLPFATVRKGFDPDQVRSHIRSLEQDAENSLRQRQRTLLLPHQDGLEGWRRWEQMFEAAISDQFGIRPGTAPSADETSCVDLSDPADPIDRGDPEPLGQVDEPRWQTSSSGEDAHWLTAEAASVPYSRADLEVLARVPDGALSFVYLLHPDPWPKARHAKRRMMNDGPVDLFAAKLKPGGEFRFGTDHPVYLRHALMVMQRHRDQFDWLCEKPGDFQKRPGGWPETRYEAKARRIGHEVWYFRYRKRDA